MDGSCGPGGEVASVVLAALEGGLRWAPEALGPPQCDRLALAIWAANQALRERIAADRRFTDAAASLCVARVSPGWLTVAHLGDVRVGRLRQGSLGWLSEDHSLWTLARRAGAEPGQLETIQQRLSTIATALLGPEERLPVELAYHALAPGDRVLLCSDGVWRARPQRELEALARAPRPLGEICEALVAGAADDATALLIEVPPAGPGR